MVTLHKPSTTHKLALRPSMNKFPSEHYVLEVIRASSFSYCYLNRQIITLLSTLGIPDSVFQTFQRDAVENLKGLNVSTDFALAAFERAECDLFYNLLKMKIPISDPFIQESLLVLR